jgi:polyhydroxybutyrate depolymerase
MTRRRRAIVMLAVLTACSQRPAAQSGPPGPGNHEVTLEHGGRTRRAIVHVPPAATGGDPLPLVLAFHGGGGEAAGFQAYAGLDAVADREGFLVVYPYGLGLLPRRLLTWHSGTGCCGFARNREIDDVGFAVALLDHLRTRLPVDARRVYATGHSNGAMMAYRLAAERAERIAAIAPVAGAMDLDRFEPSHPVPVLHIHSVDDPRALYEGGLGPPFPLTNQRVQHRPVRDGLARWAARNGCTGDLRPVDEREGAARTVNAGQTATRLAYPACSTGTPVEHWRLTGSGHGWPGRLSIGVREDLIGPPTTLIDAAEEAWTFFKRFSR